MKKTLTLFAVTLTFALSLTTTAVDAQTWATTENYRAAQAIGTDLRAKRFDKATEKALTHKEVKRRAQLKDREIALIKDPKRSWREAKRDPLRFAEKHKSSFWDRFRKTKTSRSMTKKK